MKWSVNVYEWVLWPYLSGSLLLGHLTRVRTDHQQIPKHRNIGYINLMINIEQILYIVISICALPGMYDTLNRPRG